MSIVQRLNNRAATLRARKQSGFTLLELLVVVAILAAIAGTAAMALQDTDARASAAAHVAMMDELNKGVRSFRVLNRNSYPNNFDSLLQSADGSASIALLAEPTRGWSSDDIDVATVPGDAVNLLRDIGVDNLRIVALDQDPADAGTCADLPGLIASRGNAVVAGNIYLSAAANGCGLPYALAADTDTSLAVWLGGSERIIGNDLGSITLTGGAITCAANSTAPVYVAVGFGPSSSLFDTTQLGGMTSVPVYRHVGETQYNRFIGLIQVGACNGAATAAFAPADQASLVSVVDGAGDTKEEELGEWDGTRNTI